MEPTQNQTATNTEPGDHWLSSRQVDAILGIGSAMARWRMMRHMGMPRPVANVGGKNRWSAAEIARFKAEMERRYAEGEIAKRQPTASPRKHRAKRVRKAKGEVPCVPK